MHFFILLALLLAGTPRLTFDLYPTAVTVGADSVSSSSARIRAICNPNGSPATAFFEWGLSLEPDTSSTTTALRALGDSTNGVEFSEVVGPLMPGQTYYYRVWIAKTDAANQGSYSDIRSFTTETDTIALWMTIPLKLTQTEGPGPTIRFGVHSYATDCADPGLGELPLPPRPPEGTMEARFLGRCLGLGVYLDLRPFDSPAQVDTYRVSFLSGGMGYPVTVSWPQLGGFYAGPVTLRTADDSIDMMASTHCSISNTDIENLRIIAAGPKPEKICPSVRTDTASSSTPADVHLSATIFPHGLSTTAWFEWGKTAQYGNETPRQALGDTIGGVTLEADLSGLAGHSLYHYRAVAQNRAGIIFGSDLAFTTPGGSGDGLPRAFRLYQNYPNPFNPTTLIRYDLPVDAHVVIRIFDFLGRQIQTLLDRQQEAGFKSVPFDAAGLPTGIYLYRLTAGPFTDIKKAIVLR